MVLGAGCGPSGEGEVVARVGNRQLTWERVRQEIPLGLPDSLKAKAAKAFVNHWVEEELLLLEAHNRQVDEESWVARAVEQYRRQVLISRLLDWEVAVDTMLTREEVEGYYRDHLGEFARPEDEVLMGYLVTGDRAIANRARSNWISGSTLAEILSVEVNIWGEDSIVVSRSELGALETMLHGMTEGSVSRVEPTGDNWTVFRVYRHFLAGSVRELGEVKQEIRARLLAELRREVRGRFLETLRNKYPVEVSSELVSGGAVVLREDKD
jgi:hypothetical protein